MIGCQLDEFDHSKLQKMQHQMLSFLHYLKSHHFHLDIESQYTAQQLLSTTDFSDPTSLQHYLRSLLCKNVKQWREFDQLYRDYWLPKNKQVVRKNHSINSSSDKKNTVKNEHQKGEQAKDEKNKKTGYSSSDQQDINVGSSDANDQASAMSANETVDFSFLDDKQLIQDFTTTCIELVNHLSKRLRKRRNASRGVQINLQQTMQQSIRSGGELIDLIFHKRPKVKPTFTLLIDVSRSMSSYSNAFIIFAWALVKILPNTRVFVFNTTLVDISTPLKEKGVQAVQQQLKLLNNSWGGGTRIATSLQQLAKHNINAKRGSHYFIVHSDGLDTDPSLALAQQLKTLKKQCRALIWLSPLLKSIDNSVETVSLKHSLAYIDHFLPIHNMSCLRELVKLLTSRKTAFPLTSFNLSGIDYV